MEKILVIDFGSQYTQLIARRLRELSVYSEVCPWDEIPDLSDVKGFILSGGPESSNIEGNPSIHQHIFDTKKPILGICRGFQEFNVAFGGSLHPEIRDLPGRMNHRMPPDGTLEQKFALRHKVTFLAGSVFEKIFCKKEINVNSLHGQGIDQPGQRVSIDGVAPDGTPEAISIVGSKGFCLAVQWHPEWQASRDENSVKLFSAFRDALKKKTFASSEEKLVG